MQHSSPRTVTINVFVECLTPGFHGHQMPDKIKMCLANTAYAKLNKSTTYVCRIIIAMTAKYRNENTCKMIRLPPNASAAAFPILPMM